MLAEKKPSDLVSAYGQSFLAGLMNSESSWRICQDKHLQKIRMTCLKENKIFSIRKVAIRMTSCKLFFKKMNEPNSEHAKREKESFEVDKCYNI